MDGTQSDLVEDQVTYPIVTSLLSAPHVTDVRGYSMFGMSFVYVVFEDGTDIYWARSRVLEYMKQFEGKITAGGHADYRAGRHFTRLGVSICAG